MNSEVSCKFSKEEITILENWLEEVDQAGPSMSMEELEKFVFEAPEIVKETQEYCYILGLYDGRMFLLDKRVFLNK